MSWGAPSQPGLGPILNYTVAWWSNQTLPLNHTVGANATSAWISGLANGLVYQFEVAASNAFGTGPYSAPVATRPGTIPGAPTLLSVTAGNGSIAVVWLPANSTPGYAILGYIVRLDTNGTVVNESAGGNLTQWSGPGFVNGRTYRVAVRAQNMFGVGPESADGTVEPAALPSAPRNLTALWDGTVGRLQLRWTDPAYLGGLPIGNFTLSWSTSDGGSGSTRLSPRSTAYYLPAVRAGIQFHVRLAAVNRVGEGAPAALDASTPILKGPQFASPFATPLGVGLLLLGLVLLTVTLLLLLFRRQARSTRGRSRT